MEYITQPKVVNRTRILKRTNAIAGMTKYGVDHFKLKNVLGDLGKSIANVVISPVKAVAKIVGNKEADAKIDQWGYQATDFANDAYGEKVEAANKVFDKITNVGVLVGGTLLGANAVKNVVEKVQDKKVLDADVQSAIAAGNISTTNSNPDAPMGKVLGATPAVASSIAGGEPVKADIITTAVKAVNDVGTKVEKVVPISTVVGLGKKLLGTKGTGTNPIPASNVALKKDVPVQTNVVQASTPVSLPNMTMIYVAIGAVVLVVLFSQSKS